MTKKPQRCDLTVIGLGYVGLPLAIEAARAGLRVYGIDEDEGKLDQLLAGRSYVSDIADSDVQGALDLGFSPTSNRDCLSRSDVIAVCVPTPLQEGAPNLTAVTSAVQMIANRLTDGTLVIIESTTYPGTTEEVVKPILDRGQRQAGRDYLLAYSPERLDPGNSQYCLTNIPKIVGGVTPNCTEAAKQFYSQIVREVVAVSSPRTAEMTKLLENTYRQVNIALVNEMAIFCRDLDIDLWEVIEAAITKPFGFQAFYPGPGVGGHCIPVDPNYLSHRVRTLGFPFRFVELAQDINDRMPYFVVERVIRILNDRSRSVRDSSVLLLGVTYKANVADDRQSPAQIIGEQLLRLGAELRYHDPYVASWRVLDQELTSEKSWESAAGEADIVVLLQGHREYNGDGLADRAKVIFDTRGLLAGRNVIRL